MKILNKWAYQCLSKLLRPSVRSAALDDFQYRCDEIEREHSAFKAAVWLQQQILFLCLAGLRATFCDLTDAGRESLVMTMRRLKKERTFMLINGIGLAAGLFCVLTILVFVRHESKYDRFHKKADRIYRITLDASLAGDQIQAPHSSIPLAPALKAASSDIEAYARLYQLDNAAVATDEEQFDRCKVFYADPGFFDVFTSAVMHQDNSILLEAPFSVVITEEAALRFFGKVNAVGEVLHLREGLQVSVSAVIEGMPEASHFHFDVLLAMSTMERFSSGRLQRWLPFNCYSYLLLHEKADLAGIETTMTELIDTHLGDILKSVGGTARCTLQPLKAIHLHSNLAGELEANGNAGALYIMGGIGLFVLAVAALNTLNLMTARRLILGREMTIRQTLGAARGRLAGQMLLETFWAVLGAAVLAWLLIALFARALSNYIGIPMTVESSDVLWLAAATLIIMMVFTVCAGFVPVLMLIKKKPLIIHRYPVDVMGGKGHRHWLVLLQFTISTVLIIAAGTVRNQLNFFHHKDMGFSRDHRIILDVQSAEMDRQLRDALTAVPGVLETGRASRLPGDDFFKQPILPEGRSEDERINMKEIIVDPSFFSTLGVEIKAGRQFDRRRPADEQESVIINERAAQVLGWENPIGKVISLDPRREDRKVIVGVLADFNFESLHHQVAPLYVTCQFDRWGYRVIHIQPENSQRTMAVIEEIWSRVSHGQPFAYRILDGTFKHRYRSEERLVRLIRLFTALALLIASLGLWGMAVHLTERKTKEVGIRRTLGASSGSIGWLLSHQMLKWIFWANVLAWPAAFWILRMWLSQYAFVHNVSIWLYPGAALMMLGVGTLAIGWHTWQAARANPVQALRYE